MPSNYESIAADNIRKYGTDIDRYGPVLLANLYSDRTHFVYELLQNAEDASATQIEFLLLPDRLEVRHDGRPFNEQDVRGVCGLVEGTKTDDLTKIGKFGIGFKSVYAYTRSPQIHSGEESFRIESFVRPRSVTRQPLGSGETLILLPFDHTDIASEQAVAEISQRLARLDSRTLLFLRHLEEVSWRTTQQGCGTFLRSEEPGPEGTRRVVLLSQVADGEDEEETWLVFQREVPGPLDGTHSVGSGLKVEIAFLVEKDSATQAERLVPVDGAPLVAFFPTEKETHLKFLIQGPYRTTPARDNIPRLESWNQHLIRQTAALTSAALWYIREMGLLTAEFLDVLPQASDFPSSAYGEMFEPILEASLTALREKPLLPTGNGQFVSASQALLSRTEAMRRLLSSDDLTVLGGEPGMQWLDKEVGTQGKRRFSLLRSDLEVPLWDPETFVSRCEQHREKVKPWLECKSDEWLAELYAFLADQRALKLRLGRIPIVRLADGSMVTALDEKGFPMVYLPPTNEQRLPEAALFRLVKPSVLRLQASDGRIEESDTERAQNRPMTFFKEVLSLWEPKASDVILKSILPRYKGSQHPTRQEHGEHFRYIFSRMRVMAKESTQYGSEYQKVLTGLRNTAWLLLRQDQDADNPTYRLPADLYLPASYTGSPDLETYFENHASVAFIADAYLAISGSANEISDFLHDLGVRGQPLLLPLRLSDERKRWLRVSREHRRDRDYSTNNDLDLAGLEDFLKTLPDSSDPLNRSLCLWRLLIAYGDQLRFSGEYYWEYGYRFSQTGQARFRTLLACRLQDTAWLPDQHGEFHKPHDLYILSNDEAPNDLFPSLHPAFPIHEDASRSLAERLGVQRELTPENVVQRFTKLIASEGSPSLPNLEAIYQYLNSFLSWATHSYRITEALKGLEHKPAWLGSSKEGFGLYRKSELLQDDHELRARLFAEHGIPIWSAAYVRRFPHLTAALALQRCSQVVSTTTHTGEAEIDDRWTKQVNTILDDIRGFMRSFDLDEGLVPAAVTVTKTGSVEVVYTVGTQEVVEQTAHAGVLVEGQLFISDELGDDEVPDQIGEILQSTLIQEAQPLREFVKDLLAVGPEQRHSVWQRWHRRGLSLREFPTSADGRGLVRSDPGIREASSDDARGPDTASDYDFPQALKEAFDRPGAKTGQDEHYAPGPVPDPTRRAAKLTEEIAWQRAHEPPKEQRFTRVPAKRWERKNSEVRTFLQEQYEGRCQICGETFVKRNGEPYFEGLYLVSRTEASWLDRPGNVLCLCANHCAEFEHGSVEVEDIEGQIRSWQPRNAGGVSDLVLRIRLCGREVGIRFLERHAMELQALLNARKRESSEGL